MNPHQPLLSSIFSLAGPDLLVIAAIVAALSIPYFALAGLCRIFRKPRSELPPVGTPSGEAPPKVSDRLTQLQTMRENDMISEAEYQTQRKRILDSL